MNMDLLTPNPKVTSRPIEYASPTTLAHSDRRWPPPGLLKGALMRLQHYLPRFRGARGLLVASFRTANIPETWAELGLMGGVSWKLCVQHKKDGNGAQNNDSTHQRQGSSTNFHGICHDSEVLAASSWRS